MQTVSYVLLYPDDYHAIISGLKNAFKQSIVDVYDQLTQEDYLYVCTLYVHVWNL